MALMAVRLIDVAIFFSLGGLWIFGAVFIVVLYRWIARFERATSEPPPSASAPVTTTPASAAPPRAIARLAPPPTHAQPGLGQRA